MCPCGRNARGDIFPTGVGEKLGSREQPVETGMSLAEERQGRVGEVGEDLDK